MKRKLSKLLGIGLTIAMLISLVVAAAPAAAISQPSVALAQIDAGNPANVISKFNTYTITFTAGAAAAAGDIIVVTFPTDTDVSTLVAGDCTLASTAGIGGGGSAGAAIPIVTIAPGLTNNVLNITVPGAAAYGSGSIVQLVLGKAGATGIKNPPTQNEAYTLAVKVQTAIAVPIEAEVTSAAYAINNPSLNPLPGIVYAKNSAGTTMAQTNVIMDAVNAAGVGGRVEIGAGYYDENVILTTANSKGMTIIAIDGPGTAVIKNVDGDAVEFGTFAITTVATATQPLVIDGLKFEQSKTNAPAIPITLAATTTFVTIQNCTIEAGATAAIQSNGAGVNTVKDCTIDANDGTAAVRLGIDANDQMTITGCTFDVGANDVAIDTVAGAGATPTVITKSKFNGSSGTGVVVSGGVASITENEFNTLTTAILVTAGAGNVDNVVIDGCGGTAAAAASAVSVTGGALNIINSTVKNTSTANVNNYAFNVAAGAATLKFNNITDNAKNINAAVAVDATHNWWGASTGPAAGSIVGGALVTTVPVITQASSSAAVVNNAATNIAKDKVGIDVVGLTAAGATPATPPVTIGVSKYAANPELVAPPIAGTGSVVGYYDVFVDNTAVGADTATIQIKFYGAVTQYTKVYYAGGIGGQWSQPIVTATGAPAWGVNVAGGYAYVQLSNVVGSTTTPTINDLAGTPFALVEDKTLAAPSIATLDGGSPAIGAYDISVTPTFTWKAVAGAHHYEIALCEDPTFTIIEWAYNVNDPFFKSTDPLRYETTYYWRVRGVLDAGSTAFTPWAAGIFTTEAEAVEVETTTPVEVVTPKPEITVEIPPTKITVEPAPPAIPTYLLWIIVVVGAVLVIALIILIVRTRRVA